MLRTTVPESFEKKKNTQLKDCPDQVACGHVYGVISWLLVGVGRLSPL